MYLIEHPGITGSVLLIIFEVSVLHIVFNGRKITQNYPISCGNSNFFRKDDAHWR